MDEEVYKEAIPENFNEETYAEEQAVDMNESEEIDVPYSRAKVIKIIAEEERNIDDSEIGINAPTQIVEVLIVKGLHQGETVHA